MTNKKPLVPKPPNIKEALSNKNSFVDYAKVHPMPQESKFPTEESNHVSIDNDARIA